MFRRCAATPADDLRARLDELTCIAGHVLRRAQIDVAPFDRARHAGVRLGDDRQLSEAAHLLDGIQHRYRAHAAIAAHHVGAPLRQFGGEGFRGGTVEAIAFFVNGDHRDHGNVRAHHARSFDGLMDFLQITEGLEKNDIHSAFHQRRDLLAETFARLLQRDFAQRLNAKAQRADRAGDKKGLPRFFLGDQFAGQSSAGQIDLARLLGKAMARQAE